jgi:uncharacterized protein (TIGR03663 family)
MTATASTSDYGLTAARAPLLGRITLNWEVAAYIAILLLAIFTRFYILGARVMSHDESLHTKFSHDLYQDGVFVHTPLMHGPILFHAVAFNYFMFGDNDFAARIYPAALGVIMTVFFPVMFRRWLGKWGALLLAIMLLISPLWMYYNRYIREDTPNIFAAFLMAWCFFMYIDGPRHLRRKARWLYIGAAAMLWMLGSKETGFIYIAIFGSFLTLYWAARLIQHFRSVPAQSLFYGTTIAILLGGVAALIMYVVFNIALQPFPSLNERLGHLNAQVTGLFQGLPISIEAATFFNWSALVALVVVLVVVATKLWAFRGDLGRIRFMEIVVVLLLALGVCLALLYVEELSIVPSRTQPTTAEVPGEVQAVATGVDVRELPIIGAWVLAGAVIVAVLYMQQSGLVRKLYRFRELDVLIMMGVLILPWITPLIISMTGASPTDYSTNGIIRAVIAGLPLVAVSVVVGVVWNWRRFLLYSACFWVPFVFFFTTMFTNPNGLWSGVIGSLGYWLEQQGVRRGSQPNYYYQVIVMPIYEYLPVIGSLLAMLAGMVIFWRRRREEIIYSDAKRLASQHDAQDVLFAPGAPGGDKPKRSETDDPFELRPNIPYSTIIAPSRARTFRLTHLPFTLFFAWVAVMNFLALTLAGEKMPWLGTHLTVPMMFVAAWYFGTVFSRVDWARFRQSGWLYVILLPLLGVALFGIAQPLIIGRDLFGLMQTQLQQAGGWFAAIVVAGVAAVAVAQIVRRSGGLHLRQMIGVVAFAGLSLLTFRTAAVAAFINYDYASEFLVYAHAAPGWTLMMEQIEDISRRTTNGMDIRFAWGGNAWPASWYFRNLTNATYFGENPSPQQLSEVAAVYVSSDVRPRVEPLLEDRYTRFDYTRMWWPMQDYFNLTAGRVLNVFDFSPGNPQAAALREGLLDIWWSRDYRRYGEATGGTFSLTNWPISETMSFYVRKDIAAQIWSLGVGEGTALASSQETAVNQCVANWQAASASLIFQQPPTGALNHPVDIVVDAQNRVYVADEFNNRIVVFNADGTYVTEYTRSGSTSGAFQRPNGVALMPEGNLVVADTWNYRIQVLDDEGAPTVGWGQPLSVGFDAPQQPVDGFWGPRDVATDADGNIYVSDTGNKRVRVYDSNGIFLRDIGGGGAALGQLNEPSGLAIHPDGRLFVADTWNRRVSVFSLDGAALYEFDVRGWYDDLGNRPYVAVDPVRSLAYVTDPDAGRVLVYDSMGNCVGSFGQPGSEPLQPNQFSISAGIAVDARGNVYVTDAGASRVLVFGPFVTAMDQGSSSSQAEPPDESSAETTAETSSDASSG